MRRRQKRQALGFRPSQVHQHPVSRKAPEPGARELFRVNRQLLLASRPLLAAAKVVKHVKSAPYVNARGKTALRTWTEEQHVAPVYGKPTFRNVLEDGELK